MTTKFIRDISGPEIYDVSGSLLGREKNWVLDGAMSVSIDKSLHTTTISIDPTRATNDFTVELNINRSGSYLTGLEEVSLYPRSHQLTGTYGVNSLISGSTLVCSINDTEALLTTTFTSVSASIASDLVDLGSFVVLVGQSGSFVSSVETLENISDMYKYGDGSDGSVSLTGSFTLTRDAYYDSLTLSSPGHLYVNGYRLYVRDTLDLSNVTGTAISVADTSFLSGTLGGRVTGGIGGSSSIGPAGGNSGSNGQSLSHGLGGAGGNGGDGDHVGYELSGSGGSGGTIIYGTTLRFPKWNEHFFLQDNMLMGGAPGAGGGSGATYTTGDISGVGGTGGTSGGTIVIYSKSIIRPSTVVSGVIDASGGNGDNGTAYVSGTTGVGGSGGGGGGGGGYVYIYTETVTGPTGSTIIAHGGNGGNGGIGLQYGGSGLGGNGGNGGNGGDGGKIDYSIGPIGTTATGSLGAAGATGATGATGGVDTMGGTGGTGGTCTLSL